MRAQPSLVLGFRRSRVVFPTSKAKEVLYVFYVGIVRMLTRELAALVQHRLERGERLARRGFPEPVTARVPQDARQTLKRLVAEPIQILREVREVVDGASP